MRIAHLILTHKNPEQLGLLIDALQHPEADCFIHIDQKVDIAPFLFLERREQVFFIRERAVIHWAAWGTIQATMNGFREIMNKGYDYVNVISGQDLPTKSPSDLLEYLEKNNGKEFITCHIPGSEDWPGTRPRVSQYHFINWNIPGKFRLASIFNKIVPERKAPFHYTIVGRANWFTLTLDAVEYCLSFLDHNPVFVRYFKYCWGADEFIFSTILYNSAFRGRLTNNLVYVDWRGQHHGHPKTLTMADLKDIEASGKFFARKFDASTDKEVIRALLKKEPV